MDTWSKLREELIRVTGIKNVYYQPPSNVKMIFPCIRFKLDQTNIKYASNNTHTIRMRYQITYVSNSVNDSIIELLITNLAYCSFDRIYVSDNLYHYVFTIFYK